MPPSHSLKLFKRRRHGIQANMSFNFTKSAFHLSEVLYTSTLRIDLVV